jgi:hypothetical protein
MPVIRRNYLDLSEELRREGAKNARARLKSALANPLLTPLQLRQLQDQVVKLDRWEAGTLHLAQAPNTEDTEDLRAKMQELLGSSN